MAFRNFLNTILPSIFSHSAQDKIEAETPKPYFTKFSKTLRVMHYLRELTLIDRNDHTIAILPYFDVMPLKEGCSLVRAMKVTDSYDDAKCGFIDEVGKLVAPVIYDDADEFSCGLAFVEKDGKVGFINPMGQTVIPHQFEETYGFEEGLAVVQLDIAGKWGYIDLTGKMITNFIYDDASSFSQSLARVEVDGKWGFVDRTGQIAIKPIFDQIFSFKSGLAAVKLNNKWGYINKFGTVIIPYQFDWTEGFAEGLAFVVVAGKYGYIDTTGTIVIQPNYQRVENFISGLAIVYTNSGILRKLTSGFIDQSGTIVMPLIYDMVNEFDNGVAEVTYKGRKLWINKAGNEVADPNQKTIDKVMAAERRKP